MFLSFLGETYHSRFEQARMGAFKQSLNRVFSFEKKRRGGGQASFELLLLVAFVIALSFLLVSYFFQESAQTKIEAMTKSIALRELNKDPNFHFINSVAYNSSASSVIICLKPLIPELDAGVKNAIENEIKQNPQVTTVTFSYTNEKAC